MTILAYHTTQIDHMHEPLYLINLFFIYIYHYCDLYEIVRIIFIAMPCKRLGGFGLWILFCSRSNPASSFAACLFSLAFCHYAKI